MNNDSIVDRVDDQGQIRINSSSLPSGDHEDHTDAMTKAVLDANIFDQNTEIGLVNLTLAAHHVPDSGSTLLLLGGAIGLMGLHKRNKRRSLHR